METTKITEKMPEIVKETVGQAQARLTTLEGEARKKVTETWSRIQDWHKARIQHVEQTTNDWHYKALHTMGLATHADIEQVNKQINRLRNELKKINKKTSHPGAQRGGNKNASTPRRGGNRNPNKA